MNETPVIDKEVKEQHEQEQKHCLNCGKELLGRYCFHCGQESDTRRFTIKSLGKQLYGNYRKFDNEFRRTFYALAVTPGKFCREYLEGKRKAYTTPIKYFFITFAVQILLFSAIKYVAESPEIDAAASIDQRTQLIVMCSAFFWAGVYTLLFRKAGYNLAENTVCMLFLSGQIRIYATILQLLLLPLSKVTASSRAITSIALVLLDITYYTFFSRQHFGEGWARTILKNLLVVALFIFIFLPLVYMDIIFEEMIEAWRTADAE